MIIRASNIRKLYSGKVEAVKNVSLELEKGKFYAVMGHSGSGKTTLLQLLGLLDKMTSGELYIDGRNVSNLNENQKARMRMEKLGFVFQAFYLNPKLKAYENVMLPMYINEKYSNSDLKAKAMELLEQLGLSDRSNHYPRELSGGEQQRVAIARALANNPDCIFADEPTGNLDIENETIVFENLKNLSREGKCVLVVSHNETVKEYADKLFYMDKGLLSEEI
jgi:ABC-type lipoprotein export system ATPase subunit